MQGASQIANYFSIQLRLNEANMKLRKALDKAKKIREGAPQSELPGKIKVGEKLPANDWRPPVYSDSTSIELNTETLLANRCICIEPESAEIDCYKVLRTKIQQLTQQNGWNTVMITSPRPGEGKTLTSINLALTFSRAFNQTVLLVDSDLRHQNVHRVLGFESDSGLIDYLVEDKPLKEFNIWPGIDKLTLISGGRTIQNSTELLGSPKMKAVIDEMKSRYDDRYILFDAAPVLISADALALAPLVDCIIMVVEEGRTSTKDVQKAIEMIPREKFLGFVLNRESKAIAEDNNYYYR
jgi:protein-tyrosine kinase